MKLLSVLMTCYNREKYIGEAITSVLSSTFADFELIIVDDNSSDKSFQIAKHFANLDNRIQLFQNEKNCGDYVNRNIAASYATGKYLKYLDSDDLIYRNSLEIMVRHMENNPEVALGFSHSSSQDDKKPFPIIYNSEDAFKKEFFEGGLFYSGPSSSIIRRDCFIEVGGFTGRRFIGDVELWYKLATNYPVMAFQSSLIWWRIHDGQEFQLELKTGIGIIERYNFTNEFVGEKLLLFTDTQKLRILRQNKNSICYSVFKFFVGFEFKRAIDTMLKTNISPIDVIRFLLDKTIFKYFR